MGILDQYSLSCKKLCSSIKINSGGRQGRERCKPSSLSPGTSVFLSRVNLKQIIVILIYKLLSIILTYYSVQFMFILYQSLFGKSKL